MSHNVVIDKIEKSNVMEDHYSKSVDPWGNRESQTYQKVLKEACIRTFKFLKDKNPKDNYAYYDIGSGGGNVLDTVLENKPQDINLELYGCDISESAYKYLKENYHFSGFDVIDLEDYNSNDSNQFLHNLNKADLITIVDVMYYFDAKRGYKVTLDELWNTFKKGAIIVVADSLIPFQRRSYFKTKSDCTTLDEFTDYTQPVSTFNGNKNRYLKIKIYQKL